MNDPKYLLSFLKSFLSFVVGYREALSNLQFPMIRKSGCFFSYMNDFTQSMKQFMYFPCPYQIPTHPPILILPNRESLTPPWIGCILLFLLFQRIESSESFLSPILPPCLNLTLPCSRITSPYPSLIR